MEVCPLYQHLGQEEAVARGKLSLLQGLAAGYLAPSQRLRQILELCLLCGACREKCTADIDTPALVRAGRARLFAAQGWGWSPALALAHLSLTTKSLWPRLAVQRPQLARLKRWLAPRRGFWYRLWPGLLGLLTRMPLPAPQPFSALAPEYLPGRGPLRLAFFSGCGIQALFPEAGLAFLRLCQRLGLEVISPQDQECCGLLAAGAGAQEVARTLARRFLQTFGKLNVERIVTLCASCSYHLQKLPELLPPGPEQELAAKLRPKVQEASVFLAREVNLPPLLRPLAAAPPVVSFHDPCHLRRGQGIWEEPRHLLQRLPQVDWQEAAAPGRCCGQGGIFGLCQPQISASLGQQAWNLYQAGGTAIVATACSGCQLQLASLAPPHTTSRFLVELLAEAYCGPA